MNREHPARRAASSGLAGAVLGFCGLALAGVVDGLGSGDLRWGAALSVAGLLVMGGALFGASPLGRRRSGAALAVAAYAGLLTGVLLLGCLVAVLVTGRLPRAHERDVVLPALLGAAVAAALFAGLLPATRKTVAALGRTRRGRPEGVVRNFAERSSRGAGEDDLLDLADSLRRTMGMRAAEIWRVEGTALRRVASSPNRGALSVAISAIQRDVLSQSDIAGPSWLELWVPELAAGRSTTEVRAVAAAHFGELLGVVVVEKQQGEPFTPGEDQALVDLGHRLGTVLGNLELDSALRRTLGDLQRANEALQASRGRLVATADAERRRIERNLHDGAQQHLVAMAISIGLIRSQITEQPDVADDLLEQLASQLRATIDEVRELAHGIYPPALTHGGLVEALRSVIGRSPQQIDLAATAVRRYPTATEAAVYFCCLEALQNASKHAAEASVSIALTGTEGRLEFAVRDDGPGYDPATVTHGHGLENMADRVGALGGEISWESAPGRGVAVLGWVPVTVVDEGTP